MAKGKRDDHSQGYIDAKAYEKTVADKGYDWVGKRIPNREAQMKAAGEIQYIDDLRMPGMLHAKLLLSPHAHARIKSIDTSKAEALPGVRAVAHAFNTPRIIFNSAARFYLDSSSFDMPRTEYIFDDTVRFVGDRVGAVAADDPFIAAAAVKLIEVEYEILSATITLEAALVEGVAQANPAGLDGTNLCGGRLAYGNDDEQAVLDAIEGADRVFTDTFHTSRVHHGYMEPVCHIAHYTRNGKLTVWTSSQNVFCFRDVLSTALDLPQSRIRVIKTVCGGAFGGKLEVMHEPVAAVLSMKTFKPVKLRLDRKETFLSSRCRHAGILTIRSGFKTDGTLVAQHVRSDLNTGAYAGAGPNTVGAQSGKMFILYRAEKMFYNGASHYTNTLPAGAMRGYGCPQIMVTRETHLDRIAREMGIDPTELRLKNVVLPHQKNCMGNDMHNAQAAECIRRGRVEFRWDERRQAAEATRTQRLRRGVSMGIAVHGNGWYPVYQDLTTVTIRMNNDGSATLLTGTHDLGTGSRTVLAQIAAEILTVPPSDIEVIEADTDVTPLDLGAQASRTTYIGGNATILAAREIRAQLIAEAAKILKVKPGRLELEKGWVTDREEPDTRCSFTEVIGSAQDGTHGPQRELIATRTFESEDSVDSYVAVFCEVEVDSHTGVVRPLSLLSVHNSGKIINPLLFEGQVHGGMHMGLGYALSEELLVDPATGQQTNPNLKGYRMFRAADMPEVQVLTVEDPESAGPFGAKSIGECATDGIAGAVVNAVSHALGGVQFDRIPLTPDYVLSKLGQPKERL
ncbi:MAG: molybdopterin cofactor-binding domain-containing protein [Spirochaetota bacterium]